MIARSFIAASGIAAAVAISPLAASAGPATAAPTTAAPAMGANYIGTYFDVTNQTGHDEWIKYDSDGSGHGAKAQFLNSDKSKVTPGSRPEIPAGQTKEFYVELYVDWGVNHQIDSDASADMYFLNSESATQPDGKVHIHGHHDDGKKSVPQTDTTPSWETWDTKFQGVKAHTESRAHVDGYDIHQDQKYDEWSDALSAREYISLS